MEKADLRQRVEDSLTDLMNQGKLYFESREGTADFMVLRLHYFDIYDEMPWPATAVVFLECKTAKGKTSKAQDNFAELVRNQGAEYHVIRSIDAVMRILG